MKFRVSVSSRIVTSSRILTSMSVVTVMSLSACATPTVVTVSKPEDYSLSCSQIQDEVRTAEKFKEDALDEKGVTGTNVAAALLFWPAIFATYDNVGDAVDAADDRINHLNMIYRDKGCRGMSTAPSGQGGS